MLQTLAGEGCEEGDEAFDEEGGGNVEKVAAEEIGEAAAEAGCEKSVEGPEDDAGEDDEGVAGMDVAAGPGVGMRMIMVATQVSAAKRAVRTSFWVLNFMGITPSFS